MLRTRLSRAHRVRVRLSKNNKQIILKAKNTQWFSLSRFILISKVIHRMHLPYIGDEVHHTGWNACSSCFDNPNRNRNRLIMPGLLSSRIYAVDVATDPKAPRIDDVSIFFLAILIYKWDDERLLFASFMIFPKKKKWDSQVPASRNQECLLKVENIYY